ASWTEEEMIQYGAVDISVAVATDRGLITPIVRNADMKGVAQISIEMKDLAGRAKEGKLKLNEFQGGGFTISNLGMFGVNSFAAIINPPQAMILAVGVGEERVVARKGQMVIRHMMNCTLAVDHRVVDRAMGAQFLRTRPSNIEQPAAMWVWEKAMADPSFDLIGVGGGPGGYVAAIRAAQLGIKTAVIERENLGGICLNWGCIPTKALLRTSEIYGLIKHADAFGLSVKDVSYDPKKVVERSRKVAGQLSNGVKMLMRKNKITVFEGSAKLAGAGKLAVAMNDKSNQTLTYKNVILATGARARNLP